MKGLVRDNPKSLGKGYRSCSPKCKLNTQSQGCKNRLTNLRLSMFTDAQKPWKKHATLDIKAGEAKHLLPALIPVLEKVFSGTMEECEQHMLAAATSLEKLVEIWDNAGLFLTPAEHHQSLDLAGGFLRKYDWLNKMVFGKGQNEFSYSSKASQLYSHGLGLQTFEPQGPMVL